MLPGKTLTVDDVLRMAWRRKWVIAIPFVVITAAAVGVAQRLPNYYRAETLILVVPQRVPEAYVKSTVTARIEDRLQTISQQILSRTRLERVIQDFDLYPDLKRTMAMEDVVERMRKDIEVSIVKGDAFRVAFTGRDPQTVMKVTARLASLFIDESLKDRAVLAEGTNQFLEAELQEARRQLVEHEKKVEEYRKRYDGQLPSQVDSNLQTIRSTEMQLQTVNEALSRDRDKIVLLDRQISDLSDSAAAEPTPAPAADGAIAVSGGSAAQTLQNARAQLQTLRLRGFKDEHPDVLRMEKIIADLQKQADAESRERRASNATPPPVTTADRARVQRLNELRLERESARLSVANREAEGKRLQSIISQYQARVAAAPTRESEMVALTRDYDTLQKSYEALLAKREDAQISANLERRQIGEQFKVLDAAQLPEKPARPNRPLIDGAAAAIALGLGIALAALLEYRDTSLNLENDIAAMLRLPTLGSIPVLMTSQDRVRRRRRRLLASVVVTGMILVAAVLVVAQRLR